MGRNSTEQSRAEQNRAEKRRVEAEDAREWPLSSEFSIQATVLQKPGKSRKCRFLVEDVEHSVGARRGKGGCEKCCEWSESHVWSNGGGILVAR